jgi:hypothetical protein
MKTELVKALTETFSKAKTAFELSVHPVPNHFVDVTKMVDLGSGSQRGVDDVMLTGYALPPAEDVKRTERRLVAEDKTVLKNPSVLDH